MLYFVLEIEKGPIHPPSWSIDPYRGLYWNVISHVMNDNRINVIALIMDQLADLRLNLEMNLYFAPSRSDLGESLLITTLLGIPLGEPDGKTPTPPPSPDTLLC